MRGAELGAEGGALAEERRPPLEGWEAGMIEMWPVDGWRRGRAGTVGAGRGEAGGAAGRRGERQKGAIESDVEDDNGRERAR